MSRETTEARAAAAASKAEWDRHHGVCSTCTTAYRARKTRTGLCDEGRGLFATARTDASAVQVSAELDAKPLPGQGALWPL